MALETAKKFMELLSTDEELQHKVEAATEAYAGDKADEKAVFEEILAPIAKEAGYEFTFADAEELAKSSEDGELSDDELAAVAGGGGGFCYIVGFSSVHTTGNDCYGGGGGLCSVLGIGIGYWKR